MKKNIILIIYLLLFPLFCFAQTELIAGWRLHSIGTSKDSKTEVGYEAAAALVLQKPTSILFQIIDRDGDSLGPIIEILTYFMDEESTSSRALAITGEAVLHDGKYNPQGTYTFFIQMNEKNRDVLRFYFPNNPLYLEGRLTQEEFLSYLVNLGIIGSIGGMGGKLKIPLSDAIFKK